MDFGGWVEKAVAALLGWGSWATVRLFQTMTRKEHAEICEQREEHLSTQLARIERSLERMDKEASDSRQDLHNKVNAMGRELSALNERTARRQAPW